MIFKFNKIYISLYNKYLVEKCAIYEVILAISHISIMFISYIIYLYVISEYTRYNILYIRFMFIINLYEKYSRIVDDKFIRSKM